MKFKLNILTLLLFILPLYLGCTVIKTSNNIEEPICFAPRDLKKLKLWKNFQYKQGKLTNVQRTLTSSTSCNGLYQLEFQLSQDRKVLYNFLWCNGEAIEFIRTKKDTINNVQFTYFKEKCGTEFATEELETIKKQFDGMTLFQGSR